MTDLPAVYPQPKLRVTASYPTCSHPESIEVEIYGDGEVTADFVAAVTTALAQVQPTGTTAAVAADLRTR